MEGVTALAASLGLLTGSCAAPSWRTPPYDLRFQRVPDPVLHPRPARADERDWWYVAEQTTVRPLGELVSPTHWADRASGGGAPALDVNAFGEVMDSTWFTNRLGRRPLTVEEVARGPNTKPRPARGLLLVESGKLSGASPGLVVVDEDGDRFIVKFDPPAHPGLASGAEVIATKILHAAGYNVPENYVLTFDSRKLVLQEGAMGPGPEGRPVPLTEKGLTDLVTLANPTLRGRVRGMFSRVLPGDPIGPFDYTGRRRDDPNDTIPHERRRSLRGLRWFSAWINNTDVRASNTFDVFREVEPDRGYVVHYLIDFGDALGSLGTKSKYANDGHEPLFSWGVLAELVFTAGLRYRWWLPAQRSPYRSVGMFEAAVFRPELWSSSIPNPAFDACDPHDTFWAASIIARFTREMVDATVAQAEYRSEDAAQYVADTLWLRREKILAMAFSRISPLSAPAVIDRTVRWTDLGVSSGLHRASDVRYRYWLEGARGRFEGSAAGARRVDLPLPALPDEGTGFLSLHVERTVARGQRLVTVLRLRRDGPRLRMIGLERPVR